MTSEYIDNAAEGIARARKLLGDEYNTPRDATLNADRVRLILEVARHELMAAVVAAGGNPFQPVGCHH